MSGSWNALRDRLCIQVCGARRGAAERMKCPAVPHREKRWLPQEEKGGQIEYSDEEAEVQEAGDDLAFLDGEFVENETQDFI